MKNHDRSKEPSPLRLNGTAVGTSRRSEETCAEGCFLWMTRALKMPAPPCSGPAALLQTHVPLLSCQCAQRDLAQQARCLGELFQVVPRPRQAPNALRRRPQPLLDTNAKASQLQGARPCTPRTHAQPERSTRHPTATLEEIPRTPWRAWTRPRAATPPITPNRRRWLLRARRNASRPYRPRAPRREMRRGRSPQRSTPPTKLPTGPNAASSGW